MSKFKKQKKISGLKNSVKSRKKRFQFFSTSKILERKKNKKFKVQKKLKKKSKRSQTFDFLKTNKKIFKTNKKILI